MKLTSPRRFRIESNSPEHTERIARLLARTCGPADAILLSGEIGSGKTVFARAFINERLRPWGFSEEVPSPTFTLVQTYEAGNGEIWHADLYRLNSSLEAVELGLEEAIGRSLCLIEWPERLGDLSLPASHRFDFSAMGFDEFRRSVGVSTNDSRFADCLSSCNGAVEQ